MDRPEKKSDEEELARSSESKGSDKEIARSAESKEIDSKIADEEKARSTETKESASNIAGSEDAGNNPKKPLEEAGRIPMKQSSETGTIPKKLSPKKPLEEAGRVPMKPSSETGTIPKKLFPINPIQDAGSVPMKPSNETGTLTKKLSPKKPLEETGGVPMKPSSETGTIPKKLSPRKPHEEAGGVPMKPPSETGAIPKKLVWEPRTTRKKQPVDSGRKSSSDPCMSPRMPHKEKNIKDMTTPIDKRWLTPKKMDSDNLKKERDFINECLSAVLKPAPLPASPQRPPSPDDSSDESVGFSDVDPREGLDALRHKNYYDEEDTKELKDLQDEMLTNRQLQLEVRSALDIFVKIQKGGLDEAEKNAEEDILYATRCLVVCVQNHVDRIKAHAERLSIEIERELYLSKHPLPWFGITNFKDLFVHLSDRKGITVSPREVKDTINLDLVLTKYRQLIDRLAPYIMRLHGVINDMAKFSKLVDQTYQTRKFFYNSIRVGNFEDAETLKDQQYLVSWLIEMARACDDHVTLASFSVLLLQDKIYEFVTENYLMMKEYKYFLRRRYYMFNKMR